MCTTRAVCCLLLIYALLVPHSTATRKLDTIILPTPHRQFFVEDRLEIAQQVSNRCLTPYFWCLLPGFAPIGTPCWCASPNGPVPGRVG